MLQIEVFPENVTIITRNIPPKDGKPGRSFYQQTAYVNLGGKFPVEMNLPLNEGEQPYIAGTYEVDPSSFVVNNFGGLELKRFGLTIKLVQLDL